MYIHSYLTYTDSTPCISISKTPDIEPRYIVLPFKPSPYIITIFPPPLEEKQRNKGGKRSFVVVKDRQTEKKVFYSGVVYRCECYVDRVIHSIEKTGERKKKKKFESRELR